MSIKATILRFCAAAMLSPFWSAGTATAGTLESVRAQRELVCGIDDDRAGYAQVDRFGQWSGISVAFCEAVAVAVLGERARVRFRALPPAEAFRALAAGEIDLMVQATAWTLSRDTELKVRFVDVLLHDGQAFMVPRNHGISSVLELSGASVCVVAETRAAEQAANFFARQRMRYQIVTSGKWEELVAAYAAGGCTALSGDLTRLAAERAALPNAAEHVILPEVIAKEPVAPAVRAGDERWFEIVRWVLMALIEAEELDVGSHNVSVKAEIQSADVRRLLGTSGNLGQSLGLDVDWARRVLSEIGNYGQIYERAMGSGSRLNLPRGHNNLWTRGGLMYGVPLR